MAEDVQVNPMAVNEPGFDVLTENVRNVLYVTHTRTSRKVAVVAVGALLVGSVHWTAGGEKGKEIKRGEELGCVHNSQRRTSSSHALTITATLHMAAAPSSWSSPRTRSSMQYQAYISTIFPYDLYRFDDDLVNNSKGTLETLVKVSSAPISVAFFMYDGLWKRSGIPLGTGEPQSDWRIVLAPSFASALP